MKKKVKVWYVLLILITPMILLAAVWAYIGQLSSTTEASVFAFMEELSRHDMQNIQGEMDNSWEELGAIYTRIQSNQCQSIQEVCSRLNTEQMSNRFDDIYLVDSKGKTYASTNIIQDGSDKNYIKPVLSGEEEYVMRFDNVDILETYTESLIYGRRCDPFQVGGVEFIGIIGFSRISIMGERLKIDSFDGRGYTGIIDVSGNYIVNRDKSAGIGKVDNFFEQLRTKTKLSETEVKKIVKSVEEREGFIEYFEYENEGTQVVSFVPIPGTTWSIILTVPKAVLNEQTQQFIRLTSIMLVVIVVILSLMMMIIVRTIVSSKTAKAAAKARGDFLSNMSHEIRTPLNGIVGLNHLMQQNLSDPVKLGEYLSKSDSTAKYLLSLVNDILDMSKLQAGKVEMVLKPLSLRVLVSTLESIMHDQMDDKNIDFQVQTEIGSPNIIGDEMRIKQILLNILGNAVKFTPRGGRITLQVHQSAVQEGKVTTAFEVEDNGCGISEEFQKKIFDAFSQELNTVSRGANGTGLGMSISSLLAQQMGGTLSVRSKLGEGSSFTFILTSDITDEVSDRETIVDARYTQTVENKKLKVLIAEDNELNAEILIEMLKSSGFETFHAVDGGQVVTSFEASDIYEFDIILMDVQMPVRNGYEATKIIRAMNRPDAKSVIIYACTANTFKEDQDKAVESGMNGFISKPIDVKKLMQQLNIEK